MAIADDTQGAKIITSRRAFLTGATAALICAPAIVRAASLMPVRAIVPIYGLGPAEHARAYLFDLDAMMRDFAEVMRIPKVWLRPPSGVYVPR